MKYKAVGIFQGDYGWELSITIPGFDDILSAAELASKGIKEVKYNISERKLFARINNSYRELIPSEVVVSKLKPESEDKAITNADDYEPVNLKIHDFWSIQGLNSTFGSLAYGVQDAEGNPIKIEDHDKKMVEK